MNKFFALSRSYHALLDIAAPAFCALLWPGDFPPPSIIILSLFTAFSGYTAVYALNDLAGYKTDKEKMKRAIAYHGYSVESAEMRHPVAQGVLSYKMAMLWTSFWFAASIIGAYMLNPIIVIILLVAGVCEAAYCMLLKVTYWRFILSGFVKAAGPISAVFVVNHSPAPGPLFFLFMWVFFWEVGGQNIPADWNDQEEDKLIGSKTIPVCFSENVSKKIVLISVLLAVGMGSLLPLISPVSLGWPYMLASAIIGGILLLMPAYKLYNAPSISSHPSRLFSLASYYPLALSLLMVTAVVLR